MQVKNLNAYRITHKDSSIENINAENLIQALENMQIPESENPVIQTFLVKEGVSTVMEELPSEVLFTAVVGGDLQGGFIATPASGKIHVGDCIAMKAITVKGYDFVAWQRNGIFISDQSSFVYEMTPLAENEDTAVFTAIFAPSDVPYTATVSPSEASGAGCVAFPESGTVKANSTLKLIAVEAEGYTFDHWERNGSSIGANKILETVVTPLSDNEESADYVAVFTEQ